MNRDEHLLTIAADGGHRGGGGQGGGSVMLIAQLGTRMTDTRYRLVIYDRRPDAHPDGKVGFEYILNAVTREAAVLEAQPVVTLLQWLVGTGMVADLTADRPVGRAGEV